MERRSGSRLLAVGVLACATLSACTPAAEPEPRSTSAAAAALLPVGVPLVPGGTAVLSSSIAGEFSRFPQGRWELRVLALPPAEGGLPIAAAVQALRHAGFEPEGRATVRTCAGVEVRMTRAGTQVRVRSARGTPGVLEYSVTRAYGAPAAQ